MELYPQGVTTRTRAYDMFNLAKISKKYKTFLPTKVFLTAMQILTK